MISLAADRWTLVTIATVIVALVAGLGGLATEIGDWYEGLRFPPWRPPNWIFGPAWTLIFLLTATSGVLAWEQAPDDGARTGLLVLFLVNAVLNVAWSPLFFKLRRPDWALVELVFLWLSIVSLIIAVGAISPFAAGLLTPYLAWVSFAGVLNRKMVELNRPFVTFWPRNRGKAGPASGEAP
jgi:tryptophan-rich sensory protein